MPNFIYISPNFPDNHWLFCRSLCIDGMNVLGVGDCPYDALRQELRDALTEYYRVPSLSDYDAVYRAVAFFIHKYGRIDYLESNNEFWLEQDAQLRRDFNIPSGFQPEDMPPVKFKSRMKERYALAGIPTARFHMVDDREGCLAFIRELGGYPVIIKPDNGVGATRTYRITSDAELDAFFAERDDAVYIMEEFIDGEIVSYDAVIDSAGEPLFETGNRTIGSIMDIVNEQDSCRFMIRALPEALRRAGRAAVKAFGVKKRMVHFEFFRLTRDQHIGRAGEYAALEVNMRPCGGVAPSMMNYAHSTDVYQIWADMIVFDRSQKGQGTDRICAFAGRRDARSYVLSREEVLREYAGSIVEEGRLDPAIATDMGDQMFLACFDTEEQVMAFYARVLEER